MRAVYLRKSFSVIVALASTVVAQSCKCGYRDSNGNLWREAIVSTFTQPAGALAAVNADWIIATDKPAATVSSNRKHTIRDCQCVSV
ncbi:hypothetical protein MPER_06347 [Moniliophthora perniciosa FA553]|nr:hypothetical protein MPER_06347 [Moniliophthora perniciosa FA553]